MNFSKIFFKHPRVLICPLSLLFVKYLHWAYARRMWKSRGCLVKLERGPTLSVSIYIYIGYLSRIVELVLTPFCFKCFIWLNCISESMFLILIRWSDQLGNKQRRILLNAWETAIIFIFTHRLQERNWRYSCVTPVNRNVSEQ